MAIDDRRSILIVKLFNNKLIVVCVCNFLCDLFSPKIKVKKSIDASFQRVQTARHLAGLKNMNY